MAMVIKKMSFFALALMLLPLASNELIAMDMDVDSTNAAAVVGDSNGGPSSEQTNTLAAAVVAGEDAEGGSSSRGSSGSVPRHRRNNRRGNRNLGNSLPNMISQQHNAGFDEAAAEAHDTAEARRTAIVVAASTIQNPDRLEQFLDFHFPDGDAAATVLDILKSAKGFAQPEEEDAVDQGDGSSHGRDEGEETEEEGEAEIDTKMARDVVKLIALLGQVDNRTTILLNFDINQFSETLFNNRKFLRRVIVAAHQDASIAARDQASADGLTEDQESAVRLVAGRAITMLSPSPAEALNIDGIVSTLDEQFKPTEVPFVMAVILHHAKVAVDMQNAKKPAQPSHDTVREQKKNHRSHCPTCKEVACCCCGSAMGAATLWASQNVDQVTLWVTNYLASLGLQ